MPRRKRIRCELAARLRGRRERTGRTRPRKYSYWRAQVRMCRGEAIASVRFIGQARDLKLCRDCFDREARERPGDWLAFEMLEDWSLSASERQRRPTTIRTRAPEERSEDAPRRRMTMAEYRQLEEAGLDPLAPREIGELLRKELRELCIPGASAPGADSGRVGPDQERAAATSRGEPSDHDVAGSTDDARPLATEPP